MPAKRNQGRRGRSKSARNRRKNEIAAYENNAEFENADLDAEYDELNDEEERLVTEFAKELEHAESDRPIEFYTSETDFPPETLTATVTSVHRRHFKAFDEKDELICFLPRRLLIGERKYKHPVAVGDIVAVELIKQVTQEKQCLLVGIKERYSLLSRAAHFKSDQEQVIAANIDQLVIVVAAAQPAFKIRFIDRVVITAERSNIDCVICINKIDLTPDGDDPHEIADFYTKLGYKVLLLSVLESKGIEDFRQVINDKKSVLTGQSGVGKSSLLNAIQPGLGITINEVSKKTGKGKHTTTAVQMHMLDFGGSVVDTPGIRSFGMHELLKADLIAYFPEMAPYIGKCRFNNCSHTGVEPGCEIMDALDSGKIDPRRHDSYIAIYETLKN